MATLPTATPLLGSTPSRRRATRPRVAAGPGTSPPDAQLTDTVILFLALLAVVANVAVAFAVAAVVGRRAAPLRRAGAAARDAVGPHALLFAFAVAAISTAGSLYFSEVAHFTPCTLCWYQRIAMYPLVPILAVAAWRRDAGVRRYAVPLAVIGGAISAYHVLLERFPSLEAGACDPITPCSLVWFERFGYLTIPAMALSAFALIVVLLLVARSDVQEH